ncbi:transposase [Clostridium sp. HBUAS56017]|uniref:transposase n=1 Tax=Clostridium sp. HBUAS56017 TaxID=2571128 RepID=UPI0011773A9F|nr:transposase [Clostridium sp. HBUAS56017]
MKKQYSAEFKIKTVKRLEKTGEPLNKIAKELGISPPTMHGWVKNIKNHLKLLFQVADISN